MRRDFPTVGEVLDIHKDQIGRFGGEYGLRDMGALESAIMRPQIGYYDGIIEEAAALLESLAMNHPFVDGNKRAAFAATEVFLRMNAYFTSTATASKPTPSSWGFSIPTRSGSLSWWFGYQTM